MGTVRLGVFPSLNNKYLQDELAKATCKWFISHFPTQFFSHIYLDTQTNNANNYIINETGELQLVRNSMKVLQPNLRMTIKQGRNNPDEVFGSLWNVNQQPGAHIIDTDLTGYRPILYDPYGVKLAINEYTIRNQVEIQVTLQTKADQLAFLNMCDSNVKNLYVEVFDTDTHLPIPTLLMSYIRSSVFKPEILALSRMVADSDEKNKYMKEINQKFMNYMYDFSEHHIKPYMINEPNNNNSDIMYHYVQRQRVTLHLDKADADDGDRKGIMYTGFNVTLSGYIEYANPISFITSVPAIIRGTKNNWYLKSSANKNDKLYYNTIQFKEVFKDDRRRKVVNSNIWKHFYLEREVLMSAKHDSFNILDDIIVESDTPTHYYIIKALMDFIKTKDDFDSMFKILIYKNNELLDNKDYKVDEKFHFDVYNCDLGVPYYIDIFINKTLYIEYMKMINRKLKAIGIYINEDERNSHIGLDKLTNRRGVCYIPKESETVENVFIPIKPIDFLITDDSFDYYVYNGTNFICVKPEVVEARDDLDFYITVDGKKYLKADREKILIPDPKYSYFIHDRNENKYIKIENLTKFDILQQYYILKDQWKGIDSQISSFN